MRVKLLTAKKEVLMDLEIYHLVYLAFHTGKLHFESDFIIEVDGIEIERPESLDDDE